LERFEEGAWTQVSSEIATIEIDANPDPKRRARVRLLLPEAERIVMLTPAHFERAEVLQELGFKSADALHLAGAESARADVLLTCDDRMLRTAQRHAAHLHVLVRNPMDWLKEVDDAADA
jgi:predicted nucleic acid-binding protein